MDVTEGFLSLLCDDGQTRGDIRVPEGNVGKEIEEKFESGDSYLVTVLKACNYEAVIGIKNMPN